MQAKPFVFTGTAAEHQTLAGTLTGTGVHLVFPGDAASVRRALADAVAELRAADLSEASTGAVEIVLAEALNNVVEHAYGNKGRGVVELFIDHQEQRLAFRILDDGGEMPEGVAPSGETVDLDVPLNDLPEGGFGWFLIRELTQGLSYRRAGNRNELSFHIALDAPAVEL